MSTQTGECQIDAIDGTVVRGWFKSVYEGNVYTANPGWAAMFLKDAFSSLCGQERNESTLREAIKTVTFTTPNQPSTHFTLEVTNQDILAGLETGYWESYYIG